jgi:kinesin family protein 4/21/27
MSDSCVKVGIRIRPPMPKERSQICILNDFDSESIHFKNQTFTYDYVFGPDLNQAQLYEKTAAPMLKSFLDGYNVTIMAYGQTGSGKTFTMGTSDNISGSEDEGLLPRFVSDLFENISDISSQESTVSKVRFADFV